MDDSYKGEFVNCAKLKVEFGQEPESKQGFILQKGRWQVERTFAWTNFFRRLHRNNEKTAAAVAVLFIASISILLNKLQFLQSLTT